MMVEIASDGKTFHAPGCRFIHEHQGGGKVRMVTAAEAIREGYVPCVRCLRRYLGQTASLGAPRKSLEVSRNASAAPAPGGEDAPPGPDPGN